MSLEGEWPQSLQEYIRSNDVMLADASEKIISQYESEILPSDSLTEMFDVLGRSS